MNLKEWLLELKYKQRSHNLICEGITDEAVESDVNLIKKLRSCLKSIPNIDSTAIILDKCHRIDGQFKSPDHSPR